MSDYTIHPCGCDEAPALAALWQRTFGDGADLTDEFYRLLPDMGIAFGAFCADKLVGEAHLITDLALVSDNICRPIAYLYAVAMDEASRGMGIGAALVKTAENYARENGFLFCTEPAEPSLFAWYARISSMKHVSYRGKRTVPAAEGKLEMISAAEYLARRDALLGSASSVRPGLAAVEFAGAICRIYGGSLFASENGISAAYPENGILKVCELVGDEAVCSAAADKLALPVAEYSVVSPNGSAYLISDAPFPPDVLWQMTFD